MGRQKGHKNKIHIEYICDICLKKFNQKNDYNRHLNKLNPCKKQININENNDINNNINNDVNDKINDDKNDDNIITKLIEKIDLVIKQNEEFKQDIKELKEDNEKLKNQITIFNDISKSINNNQTINIQINNFNNTDYSKIDKTKLINTLVKEQGKFIYLKAIENLYLDPSKPENHNIYIADKNRGYVKKYNNGRWETDNMSIIDMIINNFVDYYKLSIDDIKSNSEKYNKLKNSINNKFKYIELCDLEYLADLEDEQLNDDTNNKERIKRCKEFREMVYEDIKILLHDKKDIVLKTHKTK